MVIASELKQGMVVRIENQIYRVLEVESKAGAAKMGGSVRAKLSNLRSGRIWEQHLRPQERLEDLELERHTMEYLYTAEGACTFMRPQQDAAWKEATLDNGVSIRVPLFIASGEIVRVDLNTGHYLDRVRAERKRRA